MSLRCKDCEITYDNHGLDMVLPRSQWALINDGDPDAGGVLCGTCIARRASRVPGATVCHVIIEVGLP